MRISQLVPVIVKNYLNESTRKRCIFLKGKSGIGKSEGVHQASALLKDHIPDWQGIIDLRMSQMDPTDLRGIPSKTEGGRTTWNVPDFFPSSGSGILFLDELTSAPPAIQAAGYQLILDRSLGSYTLPAGWMIVAAGNLVSDRGVTFQLAAPLLNRMCELQVDTVVDDWIKYAITAGCKPEVVTFVKERPDYLHKFDGKGVIAPFPTPRSWFAVSNVMDLDLKPDLRQEMFIGNVGYEAATAFEAHLRYWEKLPSIHDILQGKDVKVPEDMNGQYCVGMGLAARVDAATFDNAWKFLQKLGGDVQTLVVKLAYKRDKSIAQSACFAAWAQSNAAAFRRG